MNKEAKQLWIDALRSGKYKQGKGCLMDTNNAYCCLGVLVRVFEEYYGLKFDQKSTSCNTVGFGSLCSLAAPPEIVIDWIEINQSQQYLLMNLNDKYGCNFAGIADVLMHLD